MTTAKLAYEDFPSSEQRVLARKFREIDFTPPVDLPIVDLIELYSGIEYALPQPHGLVIQLVGASTGPACEQIALDMAWAAASALHRRVLVLICSHPSSNGSRAMPAVSANDGGRYNVIASEMAMMKVAGHDMYVADLSEWYGAVGALGALEEMDGRLVEFREVFDMIVAVPPAAEADPLATVLARHVDGNVIVVEAERTRRSAAIRVRETLARSGRPIVGTVLNGRRNYVPRWLARIL